MREDGGKPKRGGEEQMSFFEKLISLVTAVIGLVSSIITGLSQGFGLGIGLALGVGVVGFIVIRLSNDDPVMTPTPSATVAMPSNTNTPLPEFVITDIFPTRLPPSPPPLIQTSTPTATTPSQLPPTNTALPTQAIPQSELSTVAPQQDIFVRANSNVNLRALNCNVEATATRGETFTVIARNNQSSWYLVQMSSGRQLWVSSDVVTLTGDINLIPVNAAGNNLGRCLTNPPTATPIPLPIAAPTSASGSAPEITGSWTNNTCIATSGGVNWSDADGDIDYIIVAWGPDINNQGDGAFARRYPVNSSAASGTWAENFHLECTKQFEGGGCNIRFQAVDKRGNTSAVSRAYNTCP